MARQGCMLCYPFEEKRLTSWNDEFYIFQPKLDGDRGRAILDPKHGVQLLSSEETSRNFALPHIVEELEHLLPAFNNCGIYELDGEFYNHNLPHEDIHSICSRSTNLHPDHKMVGFTLFDHIVENTSCLDRLTELKLMTTMFLNKPVVDLLPATIVRNMKDIMHCYSVVLDQSFEGMIIRRCSAPYVRKRSVNIMKFKPKQHDIYTIVGWKEEISKDGVPKGRLGAIVCTSDEGTEFSVSAGLDDEDRDYYWSIRHGLRTRKVKVYYQAITKYGTPKFAIDLEIL